MPTYDPDGLVHYAKMLEERCAEMASVIKAAGIPEIAVRKAVTFETAEFIFSSLAPRRRGHDGATNAGS